MNKPVRIILLDKAQKEYEELNDVIGQQSQKGKENTQEMQLLRSIHAKISL